MAAIRTGGTTSSFSRTAGMAAASSRGGNEIAGYLTPSREEVWQWWESVRGSMHVRMNDVYRNFAAGTEFFYVHDDDTINAFAGQSEDEKKPFQIVFFGGAMRFSRIASLAVAVDMCGRPGTASRFARSIDMNGMMSIRGALNGVQRDIYAEPKGFSRRERKGRKAHAAQSTCLRSLTR